MLLFFLINIWGLIHARCNINSCSLISDAIVNHIEINYVLTKTTYKLSLVIILDYESS